MKLSTKARVLAVVAGAGLMVPVSAMASVMPTLSVQPDADVPTMQDAGALFQQNKFAEAAVLYEKIARAQPENAQAWFQMGYCLHVTGNLEKAIPAHRKAVELAPSGSQFHALGLYNLGCAYALQGKSDASFEALMKSVDGGFATSRNLDTVKQDSDLDSLRGDPRFAKFVDAMRTEVRGEELRQFDFWVGEWDVYNAGGTLIGHNRIDLLEGGLVLMENWTSASGGTGKSMNYYEPVSRTWKQIWVDSKGVLETAGVWEDGALRFRGERKTYEGQVLQHKMVFTPNEQGQVRQHIHESSDGENWEEYFNGLYVPAGSAAPGNWVSASAESKPTGPAYGKLDGMWDMVVEPEGGATIEVRLTFLREDGALTGSADAMGMEMPLHDIKLKGSELFMKLTDPDGEIFEFKGTLKGNKMSGTWTDPGGDEIEAIGTRADI